MSDVLTCLGALALELTPGSTAASTNLEQAAAGELAERVAHDLARFAPRASELDLAVVAGLFDPVELLRPGWPLHAELERLTAQAPARGGARLIAFGAHDGQLPEPLRPRAEFTGGPLRLLPFLLRGDTEIVAEVGRQFEETLLDTGMAGADTALLAQDRFGVPIEHARYLTVHDLTAMTAMQYDHAGLGALWPLIETALLAPEHEQWLDAPPEPLARYADGEVRLALFDLDAWAVLAPADLNPEQTARRFEGFERRQRQFASVLEAHGIAVTFDHCPRGADPRARLRA